VQRSERVVRVFVSSTFADMVGERDELARRIFPALRQLCESRGVSWGEVDLRWGITDQQVAEGGVLPVCLEEVRACRPYFIGLLGERYGWVPDVIPQAALDREPWLADARDRSVTELEMMQGVLNDPAMADHAFFYFRDPAFAARASELREVPLSEEAARLGDEQPDELGMSRAARLRRLKEEIRGSGLPVREPYANPEALGALVLADLTAVIEQRFPAGSEPSELDREAAPHDALASSRAETYIERPAYFERLDEHVAADGPPLVVVGESGGGKSALLANWTEAYRERLLSGAGDYQAVMVRHFVGASPESSDVLRLMRRLIRELDHGFGLGIEIPDQPSELSAVLADTLHQAAARGRAILTIDGLDQLQDRGGALDLAWLPPVIPPEMRVVVSTLPGRPLEAARARGWPTLSVEQLTADERLRLIDAFLEPYSKQLAQDHRERLAAAPACANPLFLRLVLDELRLTARHETLADRVGELTASGSISELYDQILARWEADYERDRPRLVCDVMAHLWASRRGLSEDELRDLLGEPGRPLPSAYLSPLTLAARQTLSSRSGLVGFAHQYARDAVQRRYLAEAADQTQAHEQLATYFAGIGENTGRKLDELPWQRASAHDWSGLRDTLANPEFMRALDETARFDLRRYWAELETQSPYRLADTYAPVIAHALESVLWSLGHLLGDTGHPEAALEIWRELEQSGRARGDRGGLESALGNQARILIDGGQLDAAAPLIHEAQGIARELEHQGKLAVLLGHEAIIFKRRGDLAQALELMTEEERIWRALGQRTGIAGSLGHQALIMHDRGDLAGALALHAEAERIWRELANPAGLSVSLSNQALTHEARGDFDEALVRIREGERIARELGNPRRLQTSLGNQGVILLKRGDLDGALALFKEKERICREIGDAGLISALGNQGLVAKSRGDLDAALALYREEERLARDVGSPADVQRSLGNQANALGLRGDLDGALVLLREKERLCRELDDPRSLATSLGNRATIHRRRGELQEAADLLAEATDLAVGHGYRDVLRELQDMQRVVACDHAQPPSSAARLEASAAEQTGQGTLDHLRETGMAELARGNYRAAAELFQRELDARERLGGPDEEGTLAALGNLAGARWRQGDIGAGALFSDLHTRQLRVLGPEHPDTLTSLGDIGQVRRAEGDFARARATLEQAAALSARVLGTDHPDTLRTQGNLATVLRDCGDRDGARRMHAEVVRASRRVLGPEHRETLDAQSALVVDLWLVGDFPAAHEIGAGLVEARRRILGDHHPSTLEAMGNLATTLEKRHDLAGARELREQVTEGMRLSLGPEHPNTLTSLGNLANSLEKDGDLTRARELREQMLAGRRRLFGPEHPATVQALIEVAYSLRLERDFLGAKARLDEVVEVRARTLGLGHADTQWARNLREATELEEMLATAPEPGGPDTADEFARRFATLAPLPAPSAPPPRATALPSPHAAADPARAARLNAQYLDELREWNTLPWWKRRLVPKPTPPPGI
jgi:hypothetical protein